jgi:penicillin-binding protein 1A
MADVNNFKLNFSSVVYAYDKEKNSYVEVEFLHAGENRIWVNYDKVPQNLIDAFIAIEDKRFYSHNGVDWKRTAGAVLSFITGSDSYGGSTITQQFVKKHNR